MIEVPRTDDLLATRLYQSLLIMPSDAIIIDLSHSTDDESCKEGLPLLKGVGDTLHQQKALIHLTNDEESGAPTLPSWFSTSVRTGSLRGQDEY